MTSAFYPAATQLYSFGELPFVRCIDVINYPVISDLQREEFERLPSSFVMNHKTIKTLHAGDIVITKVGSPCFASVLDESVPEVALSRTVLGLKDVRIDPYYLVAFLRSKYGFLQLMRERELTIQLQLTLERVGRIRVFVPSSRTIVNGVASLVKQYFMLFKEAIRLYSRAEDTLVKHLGLRDYKPRNELSYVGQLSQAFGVHRVDAEYFQPAYDRVTKHVMEYSNGCVPLPSRAVNVHSDYEPARYPNRTFSYVELANVDSSIGVIRDVSTIRGREAPSRARRLLRRDDVIVSSIEGSLQRTARVEEEFEGALASTGFFQFRCTEILPQVLLVLCKSVVLQAQLKRQCAGTILSAVPNQALKRIVLPLLPEDIQEEIAALVSQSHQANAKAELVFDKAKRTVEEEIERDFA